MAWINAKAARKHWKYLFCYIFSDSILVLYFWLIDYKFCKNTKIPKLKSLFFLNYSWRVVILKILLTLLEEEGYIKTFISVARIDEDCALSFIRAITTLSLKITQEVRNKLYTRSKAPEIGQGIYLCVQIARSSSYKPLK